jgi:hypothetical protein
MLYHLAQRLRHGTPLKKDPTMKFKVNGARLAVALVPALVLATQAFAQLRDTKLSDPQEPGSVIVFPKFIRGTVTLPEGATPASASELEIGVVCPKDVTCAEHQAVKIRLHWVCGTSEADLAGSFICQETDFDVTATVYEKIVLTPDGSFPGVSTRNVPFATCNKGYLIGWVISPTDDGPIKFDGLIGDAVIRESGTAQAAYPAIPIQADPALANAAAITTNGNGALLFDGLPGHYQAVTGKVLGDVRYSNRTTGPLFNRGFLTLLTLDVKSNRPNNPVFVDLDFFAAPGSFIGNENQLSTATEFICWEEIAIDRINANLTTAVMGRKGVFASGAAEKVGIFGIQDDTGPTTLLGLSENLEGPLPTAPWARATYYTLFNDSVAVPTRFRPARQ